MASPVDANRFTTSVSTAATSHTVGNPASTVVGDLLIQLVRFAGAPGTVTFTGWTQFAADSSDASDDDTRLYYRVATVGGGGDPNAMTTSNSIKLAAICWRITGAENPATTAPSVSSVVIGTAANVNPGSVPSASYIDATSPVQAGNRSVDGDGLGTDERLAQSFTAVGTSITQIGLVLAKGGSPTDNVNLNLESDSGGSPSGSVVGSIGSIAAAAITSRQRYNFSCSIAVTNGVAYWVVISRSGSRDSSNNYFVSQEASTAIAGVEKARDSGAWGAAIGSDAQLAVTGGAPASKDYLFLTVIGMDSETATATQPAGYSNLAAANSGTGGAVATNCMIWGASKQATAASEDPGAWTSSAPNAGVTAWTIAISAPAAAAAPGPTPIILKAPSRRRASRYLTFR